MWSPKTVFVVLDVCEWSADLFCICSRLYVVICSRVLSPVPVAVPDRPTVGWEYNM